MRTVIIAAIDDEPGRAGLPHFSDGDFLSRGIASAIASAADHHVAYTFDQPPVAVGQTFILDSSPVAGVARPVGTSTPAIRGFLLTAVVGFASELKSTPVAMSVIAKKKVPCHGRTS
jgi:hypothetical protein